MNVMNGKEVLDGFNKMSNGELENSFYSVFSFAIEDVDSIYEEIMENTDEEFFVENFPSLSIEKQREIMRNALESENLNSIRSQFATKVYDEIRKELLKTLGMENG